MTLKETISTIENQIKKQHNYKGYFLGDVFKINNGNVGYPNYILTPISQSFDNTATYEFTLYYIDRLLDDNSNMKDIMSAAGSQLIKVLTDVFNTENVLNGRGPILTVTNFTEKFADECAGGYITFIITTQNEIKLC